MRTLRSVVLLAFGAAAQAALAQDSPPPSSVSLAPLDPAIVDDSSRSIDTRKGVTVDFVNRSGRPIDMYWIDFQGNRRLYVRGLGPEATWPESTYSHHFWLAVASGTGGSTARDSGIRLAAFEALAPEDGSPARETAVITDPGPAESKRNSSVVNPKDGQAYVWIPPGSFNMGCSSGDSECAPGEQPAHAEAIAQGFWLGQTEVTQAAYRRVTGNNPSRHRGDSLPVEHVTWNDAAAYCAAIGGRLPTEREWEFAARGHAGITPARYGNLDDIAWHPGNSGGESHPVAQKEANAFGLFDMLGNVWEWVENEKAGGTERTLRGGSYVMNSSWSRASSAFQVEATDATGGRGFRCVGPNSGVQPPTTPPQATAPEKIAAPDPADTALISGLPYPVYRHLKDFGITPPRILRQVHPVYSEKARKARYSGTVLLKIVVDADGNVAGVRVVRGLGLGLDEKAIEAVQKWLFEPAVKDGKPVAVIATVEMSFRLK